MTALQAPRPTRGPSAAPRLTSVPPPRRQIGLAGFVVVMALVLVAGMVGVLVLTTVLQGQAFEVERRQAEATALSNRASDLESQLAEFESIQSLAVAAQELGMKPNPYPVQLRLSDGEVIGEPTKVAGNEVPSVRYVTPQQAAQELQQRRDAEAKAKAEKEAAAKKKAEKEAAAKKKAEQEAAAAQKADAEKKPAQANQPEASQAGQADE